MEHNEVQSKKLKMQTTLLVMEGMYPGYGFFYSGDLQAVCYTYDMPHQLVRHITKRFALKKLVRVTPIGAKVVSELIIEAKNGKTYSDAITPIPPELFEEVTKIHVTAYRLGALALDKEPVERQAKGYKELLLELCQEVQDKRHHLK